MYSYNRAHIIGYQTQPVEVRQTPSGTSVTDLNIVVPYSFKSESGEMINGKSFHTVTVWGPMADIAGQFIKPGTQVFISGRLQTDSWEDQQTGSKKSKTKLVALDMIILDPRDGQLPAPESAKEIATCLNQAHVVGNVTRDPELRTTTGGQKVLTIGVATNDRWRDKASGEDRERSEFHNVVIWGDLADEVSANLKKGSRVYATGRIQTRNWEGQDGAKRTTTEIIADKVLMLGISNPVASESVTNDSFADRQSSAPSVEPSAPADAPAPAEQPAAAVPNVQYSSEIKVEDLPF